MPTRREAIQALISAPILGASWVVPAIVISSQKNVSEVTPKILGERPPILGVLGSDFFMVNVDPQFNDVFPGKKVFLNGVCVFRDCFEFDLKAQWVGVIVRNEDGTSAMDGEGLSRRVRRRWIRGLVEIK